MVSMSARWRRNSPFRVRLGDHSEASISNKEEITRCVSKREEEKSTQE
jgi:hypothetical protein